MKPSIHSGAASVDSLRRIQLFHDLDAVDLQLLSSMSQVAKVPRRECVYFPEDVAQSVYFLLEGKARRARLSRQGKEITLGILTAGDLFGEQALHGARVRGSLVEVLEDATLCSMSAADFGRFVRQRPALAYELVRLLGRRKEEIEGRIEELAFWDVPTRLAKLLVRLADAHGGDAPEGILIDLPLTHQEIANLIGATRETTTAMLNGFRRDGLLTLGRKRVVITDRERLSALAAIPSTSNGNWQSAASRTPDGDGGNAARGAEQPANGVARI